MAEMSPTTKSGSRDRPSTSCARSRRGVLPRLLDCTSSRHERRHRQQGSPIGSRRSDDEEALVSNEEQPARLSPCSIHAEFGSTTLAFGPEVRRTPDATTTRAAIDESASSPGGTSTTGSPSRKSPVCSRSSAGNIAGIADVGVVFGTATDRRRLADNEPEISRDGEGCSGSGEHRRLTDQDGAGTSPTPPEPVSAGISAEQSKTRRKKGRRRPFSASAGAGHRRVAADGDGRDVRTADGGECDTDALVHRDELSDGDEIVVDPRSDDDHDDDDGAAADADVPKTKETRKKKAKRIAKRVGVSVWRGFRATCRFMYSGMRVFSMSPTINLNVTSGLTEAWRLIHYSGDDARRS